MTAHLAVNVAQARSGADACASYLAGRSIAAERQLGVACRVINSAKDPVNREFARVLLWLRVAVLGDNPRGRRGGPNTSEIRLVAAQRLTQKLRPILLDFARLDELVSGRHRTEYAETFASLKALALSHGLIDHPTPASLSKWQQSRAELESRLLDAGISEVEVSCIFSDEVGGNAIRALRKRVKAARKRRKAEDAVLARLAR